MRFFTGHNVVGYMGPLPERNSTASVLVMTHHDHLGIRPSPNSDDSIYNGAVDNASGVAALIACAYALGELYKKPYNVVPNLLPPNLQKSIIFLSTTAEEANLLGASYFVQNPPCPSYVCGIVSAFNFDTLNVWGRTQDSVVIGSGLSTAIDGVVAKAVADEGMFISPDPASGLGHLFRGDQLPFVLHGIPAVSMASGTQFIGGPSNYYQNVSANFIANRYHQPSDEYNDDMNMAGMQQQVRIVLRSAFTIATTNVLPSLDSDNGMLP